MDTHVVSALAQALGLVATWEGWKALRVWMEGRREARQLASIHPPAGPTNGFTRTDATTLAVLGERVDHLTDTVGRESDAAGLKLDKLDNTVAKLDNIVGRLVTVLEMNNAFRRPD